MQHNDIISGKMSSDIENVEWSTGTTAQITNVRFGSSSSQASQNSGDICRICHCESDPQNPLLTPCYCSGSLKYVHQTCLQQWLTASETNSCELCKFPFIMHTKIKPFNEWRSLDMSGVERRRLFCAVLFHCAAALCVIWSLCVLIERAAEEVKRGLIGWPFWTKLVVVTVGLTGGVVFMYIQCRQYLQLCHRWRARNRILLIQNAPEKIHPLSPPSPVLVLRHHNLPRTGSLSTTNVLNLNASGNSYNRPAHGQIIANIENNPLNYERDWTLDDSSQSSFKPCPQGSGSMTPLPFHDSVHTMYDQSQMRSSSHSSSHGSGHDLNQMPHTMNTTNSVGAVTAAPTLKSNDIYMFKVNASSHGNYPNSSVFLENSDILDDKDYPKLYHRHSTVLMPQEIREISTNYDQDNTNRRYSDTKLLQHANDNEYDDDDDDNLANYSDRNYSHRRADKSAPPIFNVASVLGTSIPLSMPMHADSSYIVPQVTDIIFDNKSQGGDFEPLELNIQERLDSDVTKYNARKQPRHSLNNVAFIDAKCSSSNSAGTTGTTSNYRNSSDVRNFFKSMPNLSASSENLLQK